MKLRAGEMELIGQLVRQLTGITLETNDHPLVEERLGGLADSVACANFNELYIRARYGGERALVQAIVDTVTTADTDWFADPEMFEAFRLRAVPSCLAARSELGQGGRLRVWSAATSSGQEAYGLAMVISDLLGDRVEADEVEVLGTDIARDAIGQAERGCYQEARATGAWDRLLHSYLEPAEGRLQVVAPVRALCRFEKHNLLDPIVGKGPFDVVVLRSVLGALADEVRRDLLGRVRQVTLPHGFLFVDPRFVDLAAEGPWRPLQDGPAGVLRPAKGNE